ncbi:unnamed protein product, partial [Brassica oleracea]
RYSHDLSYCISAVWYTIHNPTVMISTKNDNDFLRTCSLCCNQNLCQRRDIYMY